MQIISLDCKNCGAKLEINEEMTQLACNHCGATMLVERGGGAISLQLVEAIRAGTDKTAAELALVRLDMEQGRAASRLRDLEYAESSALCTIQHNTSDQLSEEELASAKSRVLELKSEISSLELSLRKINRASPLPIILFITGHIVAFVTIVISLFAGSSIGIILGVLVFIASWIIAVVAFFTAAVDNSHVPVRDRRKLLGRNLSEIERKISSHQQAFNRNQELSENLSRLRVQLLQVRSEVARISEEIARNRKIVG